MSDVQSFVNRYLSTGDLASLIKSLTSFTGRSKASSIVGVITKSSLQETIQALRKSESQREKDIKKLCDLHELEMLHSTDMIRKLEREGILLNRQLEVLKSELKVAVEKSSEVAKARERNRRAQARVMTIRSCLDKVIPAVELCLDAATYMDAGDLHWAQIRILQLRDLIDISVPRLETEERGQVKSLWDMVAAEMTTLKEGLKKSVRDDLNAWLTYARSSSETLGRRAIRAVQEIGGEECLLSTAGSRLPEISLATREGRNIVHLISERRTSAMMRQDGGSYAASKELSTDPLRRCVDVAMLVGGSELKALRDAYVEAREAQLASDIMSLRSEEGNDIQALLYGIVGFLAVESRVIERVPSLGSRDHAIAVWEGAAATLSAEINASLEEAADTKEMLRIKALAIAGCDAIEWECRSLHDGVSTAVVRSGLEAQVPRFCSLVAVETEPFLERILVALSVDRKDAAMVESMQSVDDLVDRIKRELVEEFLGGVVAPGEQKMIEFKLSDSIFASLIANKVVDIGTKSDSDRHDDENSADAARTASFSVHLRRHSRLLSIATRMHERQLEVSDPTVGAKIAAELDNSQVVGVVRYIEESLRHLVVMYCIQVIAPCLEEEDWAPDRMPRASDEPPEGFNELRVQLSDCLKMIEREDRIPAASKSRILASIGQGICKEMLRELASGDGGGMSMNAYGAQRLLTGLYLASGKLKGDGSGARDEKYRLAHETRSGIWGVMRPLIVFVEALAFNRLEEYEKKMHNEDSENLLPPELLCRLLDNFKDVRDAKKTGLLTRQDAVKVAKQMRHRVERRI